MADFAELTRHVWGQTSMSYNYNPQNVSTCDVAGCSALVVSQENKKGYCGQHHGGRAPVDANWIEQLYEDLYYGCAWLW